MEFNVDVVQAKLSAFCTYYPAFTGFDTDPNYALRERAWKQELVDLFQKDIAPQLRTIGAGFAGDAGSGCAFVDLFTRLLADQCFKQNLVGSRTTQFLNLEAPVPDEELEKLVRAALERRRRVKEQQMPVFKSEFRNTHFSYSMGEDGVEQFVSTPELHSDEAIDLDPLPPGQVRGITPGGPETGPSLYRREVTVGKGFGGKILNAPVAPAFRGRVSYAEQNLYSCAKELVGGRDPSAHDFSVQMHALDNDRSGAALGLPALMAQCSGLLERSTKGGLIVVGALNLGGSVEPIANAVSLVEAAVEKGADTLLMPVSARKQVFDLSDDMATRINVQFYSDASDVLLKALVE